MWKSLIDGRRIKKMFYVDEQRNLRHIKDMYSVTETGLRKWAKIPEIIFNDPIESPYCRYIGDGEQNESEFWFSFVSENGLMDSYSSSSGDNNYIVFWIAMDYVYNNDNVYDLMTFFENYGQPSFPDTDIFECEFINSNVKLFLLNGVDATIQPDAQYYSQYDFNRLPPNNLSADVVKICIYSNNEKPFSNIPDYTSHLMEIWFEDTPEFYNGIYSTLDATAAGNWEDYKSNVIMSLQGVRKLAESHAQRKRYEIKYSNNILITSRYSMSNTGYGANITGITLENPILGASGSSWLLTTLGIKFEIWRYDVNNDSWTNVYVTDDGYIDFSDANVQLTGDDCYWRFSKDTFDKLQMNDRIIVRKV